MNVMEHKQLPDRDGFELHAYKVLDMDATPDEAECYTEADKQAWRNDEWHYVIVTVEAWRNGVLLGSDSLGACEDGNMPEAGLVDAFSHTLGRRDGDNDLPSEAIDNAKATLARLEIGAIVEVLGHIGIDLNEPDWAETLANDLHGFGVRATGSK